MQTKSVSSEALRVSVSSAPSSSSQGSGQDEPDAVGDVYIWGEGIWDGILGGCAEKESGYLEPNKDALLPKPLECALALDVQRVACGVQHAALVTRQGEVFTWGEDCGGRLGHGVCSDVCQPQLVEALASTTVELVACGEYHTCAVTITGELYTWGDGSHHVGLLGHGNDVSHWIPKKISGPIDGIQVSSIACGPWHTAFVTSSGQLFTFGLGVFGVLGHGDHSNVQYPKEVELLKGLKTVAVACGVWHTAAVVDIIVAQSSATSCSGKLFTWGDGDKGRLGHGDKETKLVPTCISTLIDYNFHQIACGHSLTVGLTTSGQVFTMGSTVYGQLGNPNSDGKFPCLVEGRLLNETVEEISCGSHHIACLTSKNEVFTWGKGANGRLGHGDVEDRKAPTLVEALKEKHVKSIACGSSFTAAICLHKWVSGSEQSACAGCKQSFGFTRKRHNCYNCGLQHCHSCSSKKAFKAALAPSPNKPYRVCDSCYIKLKKASELAMLSTINKRNMVPRRFSEISDRLDKAEIRTSKPQKPPLEVKTQAKRGKRAEASPSLHTPQLTSVIPLKDMKFSSTSDVQLFTVKTFLSVPQSKNSSRAASPFSGRPSPPRSATPIPTMAGLVSSRDHFDELRRKNNEILKLKEELEFWKQKCRHKDAEVQLAAKQAHEAFSLAEAETRRCNAAKEAIKSLSSQLSSVAERVPPGTFDNEKQREMHAYAPFLNGIHHPSVLNTLSMVERESDASVVGQKTVASASISKASELGDGGVLVGSRYSHSDSFTSSQEGTEMSENGEKREREWVEQDEPGVYITLVSYPDGTKELKRVRFSRRKFSERQAELWWEENRARIHDKYNFRTGSNQRVKG